MPHKLRDTVNELVLSVMTDLRYEAAMTAAQSHCHSCTVPVSKVLMQRLQTYKVFTESYHVSEVQKVLRQSQTWPVKSRIEFNVSSRNPRQAQNLSMDSHRGVRGTISRYLNDGTPNPAYVIKWAGGLQSDFMTGGALSVTKEKLKHVEGLKKRYFKYYCKFSNILASQKDYTIAAYQLMLSLGVMAKGDFICVNQEVHSDY